MELNTGPEGASLQGAVGARLETGILGLSLKEEPRMCSSAEVGKSIFAGRGVLVVRAHRLCWVCGGRMLC